MAGDQHRHHRALTKIKWNGCYSGHHRLIHKDDLTKDNNNKYIIGRNYKNLQGRYIETTWSTKKDSQ